MSELKPEQLMAQFTRLDELLSSGKPIKWSEIEAATQGWKWVAPKMVSDEIDTKP